MITADLALDARARLGEGPVWDGDAGVLTWVDILARRVHRTVLGEGAGDEVRALDVIEVGAHVGFVALTTDGGWVAGVPGGFRLLDPAGGHRWLARLPEVSPDVRMNDGAVAPDGRLVAGTMAYDQTEGAGTLWTFDGHRVRPLVRDVTISNGLAWSADGSSMYYIDTPTGRVDRFDYDTTTGEVSGRRPYAVIPDGWGFPDGMDIDADGALWVALWGGGVVVRVDTDGTVERAVAVPTPQLTSCAWLGEGRLAITTASAGLPDGSHGAGGLYVAAVPGVRGRQATRLSLPG